MKSVDMLELKTKNFCYDTTEECSFVGIQKETFAMECKKMGHYN